MRDLRAGFSRSLAGFVVVGTVFAGLGGAQQPPSRPNIVVFLTDGRVPDDRPMDGYDLMPLLSGQGPSPRHELFFFQNARPEAVRLDVWKLRLATPAAAPELYDLDRDPGERLDVAKDHPDVVAKLRTRLETFAASLH